MTTLNTKFIRDFDIAVEKLFAPVITDGQSIICYVNEEMTPYVIQGDNIVYPQLASSTGSDNILEFHYITAQDISAKAFELAHSIDATSLSKVSMSLNGIPLISGVDFSVSENSIVWDELSLDGFGLQIGDILIVSYRPA